MLPGAPSPARVRDCELTGRETVTSLASVPLSWNPRLSFIASVSSLLTWRTEGQLRNAMLVAHLRQWQQEMRLLSWALYGDDCSCSVEERKWAWLEVPLIWVLVFPPQQTCEVWKFRFSSFSDKWQRPPSPRGPLQKATGRAAVTCAVSLCAEPWSSRSHRQGQLRSQSCARIRNSKARKGIPITEAHSGKDPLPDSQSAREETAWSDSFQMLVKKVYQWNKVVCNLL